jgi:hypothetical protein
MIWFEINKEQCENYYIDKRLERWDTEQEAIESLNTHQFQEYAYGKCVDWLHL